MFITQTSSLQHLIAHCLFSLETEFQFRDAFRCKMTVKILQHVIGILSDSKTNYRTALLYCSFLRTNYWTGHQVLLITSLQVFGLFKDFCRKFSYVLIVSGKVLFENSSRIWFINRTVHTRITDCMIIINCMCVHNLFMHCTGVIFIVIAVG